MQAFRFRAFALLASGAMVVHQLRFAIAGDSGPTAPAHAYLHAVLPAIVILAALAAGHLVACVARARGAGVAEALPRNTAFLWPACAAILTLAYLAQEWAEAGALGSPQALLAPLAHGGWTALALAVAVGRVIALLLRGAQAAIGWAARTARPALGLRARRSVPRPRTVARVAAPNPLAGFLAGRAPPPIPV